MRSFAPVIIAVLVLVAESQLPAQNKALLKGSAEAVRAENAWRRLQIERQMAWNAAKKLTLLKTIPSKPHDSSKCLSPNELSDGSVGYLDSWDYQVLSIVTPTDMTLFLDSDQPVIWLADYPTKGLVDGDKVRLVGLVRVSSTRAYKTTTGRIATVRAIQLVPLKEAVKIEERLAEKQRRDKWTSEFEKNHVVWTDKSGEFKLKAVYVRDLGRGRIELQREDESMLQISLSQLSRASRDKAIELRKADRSSKNR